MKEVKIIQNMNRAMEIMHNVGAWMEKSGLNPSKWWKSRNMNRKFMLKHTEPEEYYVAMVDDKPVASMVLQETERNQSWKSVDGNSPKKALYVHWLCVHRNFAGQGFPIRMIDYATKVAKKRGFNRLRLDTNADEKKLCKIYKDLGFSLVGSEVERKHTTAFFEKEIGSNVVH